MNPFFPVIVCISHFTDLKNQPSRITNALDVKILITFFAFPPKTTTTTHISNLNFFNNERMNEISAGERQTFFLI